MLAGLKVLRYERKISSYKLEHNKIICSMAWNTKDFGLLFVFVLNSTFIEVKVAFGMKDKTL
jgi:hypothetical protein